MGPTHYMDALYQERGNVAPFCSEGDKPRWMFYVGATIAVTARHSFSDLSQQK